MGNTSSCRVYLALVSIANKSISDAANTWGLSCCFCLNRLSTLAFAASFYFTSLTSYSFSSSLMILMLWFSMRLLAALAPDLLVGLGIFDYSGWLGWPFCFDVPVVGGSAGSSWAFAFEISAYCSTAEPSGCNLASPGGCRDFDDGVDIVVLLVNSLTLICFNFIIYKIYFEFEQ